MARDHYMDELLLPSQLLKHLGCEMHTTIRNHKLQLGWQQAAQGRDYHFGRHLGPSHKQWQAQALASTVISDHQDGHPSTDEWLLSHLLTQLLALRTPLRIALLTLFEQRSPLCAQFTPLPFATRPSHSGSSKGRPTCLRVGSSVSAQLAPGCILPPPLFTLGSTLLAQSLGLLAQAALS